MSSRCRLCRKTPVTTMRRWNPYGGRASSPRIRLPSGRASPPTTWRCAASISGRNFFCALPKLTVLCSTSNWQTRKIRSARASSGLSSSTVPKSRCGKCWIARWTCRITSLLKGARATTSSTARRTTTPSRASPGTTVLPEQPATMCWTAAAAPTRWLEEAETIPTCSGAGTARTGSIRAAPPTVISTSCDLPGTFLLRRFQPISTGKA